MKFSIKFSTKFLGVMAACLIMFLGNSTVKADNTAKLQIPMHGGGFRPHSPSDDGLDMICYLSDGMLNIEIEDFSGMIYVYIETLDGVGVHKQFYYYTNPYTLSTASLHGDYIIKIKIDDSTYQGYFNI